MVEVEVVSVVPRKSIGDSSFGVFCEFGCALDRAWVAGVVGSKSGVVSGEKGIFVSLFVILLFVTFMGVIVDLIFSINDNSSVLFLMIL